MYPVTDLYKEEIKKNGRLFTCNIIIEHSQGTLELSDVDLSQGSLVYSESSQDGEEFTVGATVASDISFTIFNKPEYENIQFMGATVFVTIGLLVKGGMGEDVHFLQASQPSPMSDRTDEIWEYVKLGRFNIDDVNKKDSTITLKAMDNMINLDKPYSLSKLSYPATLYQIYTNICSIGDISIGTLDFPNKNYLVSERPSNELTLRDVLGYVAELSGTFAKCNRNGALELGWYKPTDLEIEPNIRYDFIPSDDVVQIKGVVATAKVENEEDDSEKESVTYLAGSEDYAIDLSENPLLQGDYETVLPNIFNNVKDTIFTPYTSSFKGNPAIQAGDIIKQIDKNGTIYNTLVTKMTYKYRGKGSLEAKGLPEVSKGYKGSTNRKIAEIRRKIDVEVGDKITDLEQAMLEATELITGQMGGHVLKREGELLIMDNPNPDLAQKIWRWNLAGLGYSNTGINGPYGLAMTMNGAINANFITTGLLSANLVRTGLLESQDGSSWINLDSGNFNLKDKIKFIDNKFNLSLVGTDANVEVDEKINSAKSSVEQYADGIVSAVSSTANSAYSTANSAISTASSAQSTANTANSNATTAITKASSAKQTADSVTLDFSQFKTLASGQTLGGGTGRTTINRDGIKVTHTGLGGQYSEMRADGFVRKWRYGEAKYLNDIWVAEFSSRNYVDMHEGYVAMRITLPSSFSGRENTQIFTFPTEIVSGGGMFQSNNRTPQYLDQYCAHVAIVKSTRVFNPVTKRYDRVPSQNLNANPPWVDIEAYSETRRQYYDDTSSVYRYDPIDFMLVAIGE